MGWRLSPRVILDPPGSIFFKTETSISGRIKIVIFPLYFIILSIFCRATLQKGVQETAKQIAGKGGTAFAYKCDVSNSADVKLAAARVRQNLDHVDIVVSTSKTICAKLHCLTKCCFNKFKVIGLASVGLIPLKASNENMKGNTTRKNPSTTYGRSQPKSKIGQSLFKILKFDSNFK